MIMAPLHLQFFTDETMGWLARRAGLQMCRCNNNFWTPAVYVWSFLNMIEETSGVVLGRRLKMYLNAIAFPVVVVPAAITSLLGMKAVSRQYVFRKPRPADPPAADEPRPHEPGHNGSTGSSFGV
jgi:hypothetical protein